MRQLLVRSSFLLALAACCAPACPAQQDTAPAPPASVQDGLQELAAAAAVVFTGSVAQITAEPGGATAVRFAVEDGVRGASSGGTYTMVLSPWAGNTGRYVVGERALFLLHAPSAAGYSSPVGGERGIVPLTGDRLSGSADLRWIAAGVLRTAPVQTDGVPTRVTAATVRASGEARLGDSSSLLRSSSVTGVDVHSIDLDLVAAMLRTWATAAKAQAR